MRDTGEEWAPGVLSTLSFVRAPDVHAPVPLELHASPNAGRGGDRPPGCVGRGRAQPLPVLGLARGTRARALERLGSSGRCRGVRVGSEN